MPYIYNIVKHLEMGGPISTSPTMECVTNYIVIMILAMDGIRLPFTRLLNSFDVEMKMFTYVNCFNVLIMKSGLTLTEFDMCACTHVARFAGATYYNNITCVKSVHSSDAVFYSLFFFVQSQIIIKRYLPTNSGLLQRSALRALNYSLICENTWYSCVVTRGNNRIKIIEMMVLNLK